MDIISCHPNTGGLYIDALASLPIACVNMYGTWIHNTTAAALQGLTWPSSYTWGKSQTAFSARSISHWNLLSGLPEYMDCLSITHPFNHARSRSGCMILPDDSSWEAKQWSIFCAFIFWKSWMQKDSCRSVPSFSHPIIAHNQSSASTKASISASWLYRCKSQIHCRKKTSCCSWNIPKAHCSWCGW